MTIRPFFVNVVEAIRASAATRGTAVRQVRSDARSALHHHRQLRQSFRLAMRRALHQHRAEMIGGLKAALAPVMPRELESTAEDRTVNVPPVEHVGVWELCPETSPEIEEDSAVRLLRTDVLRVIRARPNGVGALEIGNELGLDWRWVVGVTRDLIDAGLIEQVEHEFYPVGKASREW